jgi:DNA-binding transcriptional LysR family regulator
MAEWAGEVARAAAQGEACGPRGVVRVTAPPGFAFDFVAPFARVVRDTYPDLRLEVLSAVRVLDLARGEADLALRMRPSVSSDLVVVSSLAVPARVVASKAYAAKLPKKPRLDQLDWIAWAPPFEDVSPNPELAAMIPDFRPAFTSDNYLVQWRACEAGLGAMLDGRIEHRFRLPSSIVTLDVELGEGAGSSLHLVCAKSALAVPRVRVVTDLLVAELTRLTRV